MSEYHFFLKINYSQRLALPATGRSVDTSLGKYKSEARKMPGSRAGSHHSSAPAHDGGLIFHERNGVAKTKYTAKMADE